MKNTVICQLSLGQTRVSGWLLYDHETMSFLERTPKEVKTLVRRGLVNGLMLDKDGELALDEESFNQKNILVRSGVGRYRPLREDRPLQTGLTYSLTKAADTDNGMVYEVVSSLCARLPFKEQTLRAHYAMGNLYGCWIDPVTGMITLADGIEMLDLTSEALDGTELENTIPTIEVTDDIEWDDLAGFLDDDSAEATGTNELDKLFIEDDTAGQEEPEHGEDSAVPEESGDTSAPTKKKAAAKKPSAKKTEKKTD